MVFYAKKAIKLATILQRSSICTIGEENFMSYFLYFFSRTYLANDVVFSSFSHKFEAQKEISILDIGCGLGSATMAVLSKLPVNHYVKLHINLNDISSFAITKSRELLMSCYNSKNICINEIVGDINTIFTKTQRLSFDIILISYSLYDISKGKVEYSVNLIKKLQSLLTENGIIIIVEPADKQKSTMLMNVRNDLKEYVLAPCTHSNLCPLLINSKWCYFKFDWKKPAFIQNIFYKLSCDLPDIKFSYIVIGKERLHKDINEGRVITPIFHQKGRIFFKVCFNDGVSDCIILRRDIKNDKINIWQNSVVSLQKLLLGKLIKLQ